MHLNASLHVASIHSYYIRVILFITPNSPIIIVMSFLSGKNFVMRYSAIVFIIGFTPYLLSSLPTAGDDNNENIPLTQYTSYIQYRNLANVGVTCFIFVMNQLIRI